MLKLAPSFACVPAAAFTRLVLAQVISPTGISPIISIMLNNKTVTCRVANSAKRIAVAVELASRELLHLNNPGLLAGQAGNSKDDLTALSLDSLSTSLVIPVLRRSWLPSSAPNTSELKILSLAKQVSTSGLAFMVACFSAAVPFTLNLCVCSCVSKTPLEN